MPGIPRMTWPLLEERPFSNHQTDLDRRSYTPCNLLITCLQSVSRVLDDRCWFASRSQAASLYSVTTFSPKRWPALQSMASDNSQYSGAQSNTKG